MHTLLFLLFFSSLYTLLSVSYAHSSLSFFLSSLLIYYIFYISPSRFLFCLSSPSFPFSLFPLFTSFTLSSPSFCPFPLPSIFSLFSLPLSLYSHSHTPFFPSTSPPPTTPTNHTKKHTSIYKRIVTSGSPSPHPSTPSTHPSPTPPFHPLHPTLPLHRPTNWPIVEAENATLLSLVVTADPRPRSPPPHRPYPTPVPTHRHILPPVTTHRHILPPFLSPPISYPTAHPIPPPYPAHILPPIPVPIPHPLLPPTPIPRPYPPPLPRPPPIALLQYIPKPTAFHDDYICRGRGGRATKNRLAGPPHDEGAATPRERRHAPRIQRKRAAMRDSLLDTPNPPPPPPSFVPPPSLSSLPLHFFWPPSSPFPSPIHSPFPSSSLIPPLLLPSLSVSPIILHFPHTTPFSLSLSSSPPSSPSSPLLSPPSSPHSFPPSSLQFLQIPFPFPPPTLLFRLPSSSTLLPPFSDPSPSSPLPTPSSDPLPLPPLPYTSYPSSDPLRPSYPSNPPP
ncbi:hypothetical protein C7M84_021687 [Penaeus vannamei]|uniref:Uncharacterized protein n=1 Tax=Penaeus vannamei TaxID=6689 RepID=A0A3R7P402_PENVA|nr:hypothetical protein C7M84_021687 [Penaeus vannamei]